MTYGSDARRRREQVAAARLLGGRALLLRHWRGLLVLDKCDAARQSGLMRTLLAKLREQRATMMKQTIAKSTLAPA